MLQHVIVPYMLYHVLESLVVFAIVRLHYPVREINSIVIFYSC